MSDVPRWRPTFRVLAPFDVADGSSGDSMAEIRSLDPTPPDGRTSPHALALIGDLCAYSTQALTPVLDELTGLDTDVTLDLRDVTFADASALTMLLDLGRHLAARGGVLVVDPISSCLDRLLAVSGVELNRSGDVVRSLATADAGRMLP